MESKSLKRRDFLLKAALGGGALLLANCSGVEPAAEDGGDADGDCSNGAQTTYTNVSHVHTELTLTAGDITAAVAGDYVLLGGTHTHTFNLTAGDFVTLQGGGTLTKSESDGSGHGHTITITC